MSAADLAREIIDQSKPADRPSQICIGMCYMGTVLEITAPVIDGRLVIEIRCRGVRPVRYNAKTNFDSAVAFVDTFASAKGATQVYVKSPTDDGIGSVQWYSLSLRCDDHKMTKRIEHLLLLLMTD